MNDDVKAALEKLESTFRRVHHVATGQSNEAYMSIPADPKRDADLQHMAALELLQAHIDGEPARTAAAEARAREEVREACRARVKEWWYSDDGLLELDEHVAATPLDSTPLADEVTTLRARVKELEALGEKVNIIRNSIVGAQALNWSEHAYPLVAALDAAGFKGQQYPEARENIGTLIARAEKAEARVKELEERMKVVLHAGPSTALAVSVFDRAERAEAELNRLRNERDEAVRALRGLVGESVDSFNSARAVLAKHPEGT